MYSCVFTISDKPTNIYTFYCFQLYLCVLIVLVCIGVCIEGMPLIFNMLVMEKVAEVLMLLNTSLF